MSHKSPSIRWIIGAVGLVLGACLLPSCSSEDAPRQTDDPGKPLVHVRVATAKNLWNALPLLAQEQGFFRARGIDASLDYLAAGRYCLDALVAKSADVAFIVEVNVAYYAFTGDESVATIATVARSRESAIIARKSSGVESDADLRGKTIAISPATTSDMFASRFLERNNISLDEVTIRATQPQAMFAAMTSGSVDAASTWEPFVHNIETALGEDAVVFRDPDIYTGYMNVAVRKDWARDHAEVVQHVLQALQDAAAFAREHPASAQSVLARVVNLDLDTVEAIWPMYDLRLGFDEEALLHEIEMEGTWIRATQKEYETKDMPDYASHLDARPMGKLGR